MLQQTLETNFHRLMNFLNFAKNFIRRRNPVKAMLQQIVDMVKDMLTIKKKLKISQYRLNYHKHQLHKMETLIAANNEHTFLKGRKINEVR